MSNRTLTLINRLALSLWFVLFFSSFYFYGFKPNLLFGFAVLCGGVGTLANFYSLPRTEMWQMQKNWMLLFSGIGAAFIVAAMILSQM